jgi:hypothetical protein
MLSPRATTLEGKERENTGAAGLQRMFTHIANDHEIEQQSALMLGARIVFSSIDSHLQRSESTSSGSIFTARST